MVSVDKPSLLYGSKFEKPEGTILDQGFYGGAVVIICSSFHHP
jgi:hypothetical protein